jgi:hypothetical protein
MRFPSLDSCILAAGLVLIGIINLSFNPNFVRPAHAQNVYEGSCDPSQQPCCSGGNDPCCVNGAWSCSCG